jgi:Fibronectin type III domain/Zinc carboxypeptidase
MFRPHPQDLPDPLDGACGSSALVGKRVNLMRATRRQVLLVLVALLAMVSPLVGVSSAQASAASAVSLTATDTAVPQMVEFDFTPKTVDITNGPATVTVTARVTDATGVQDPTIQFVSNATSQTAGFGSMTRTSGTALDGTFSRTITIPQGGPTGAWSVSVFPLSDIVGNSGSFDPPAGYPKTLTVNATTPAPAKPTAPSTVTATAGDSTASLSWTPPASDGGSPISGYTVTSSPISAGCVTTGARTCTITGLSNGTAYTFTVTATNTAGTSPASAASAAVIPNGPVSTPGAPTGVTAVPGNASATVRWTAPASDGGSPITGYTITAAPGGRTATTTGATTTTITWLSNGTGYTFTVKATNSAGTSPSSVASAAVTPKAPPIPFKVSLSITSRAYVGTAITASTKVTDQYGKAKANWTVTLQKKQSGTSTWKSVKSLKTTSTGAASYRFANGPSGYYRWVTLVATGAPSKVSASVKVTSTARVVERRPATSMTRGRYLSVSGSVSSVPSPAVYIQYRYAGGLWRTGPRATARGTAVGGKIKLTGIGTAYTRLYVKSATSYRGSVSGSYATTVAEYHTGTQTIGHSVQGRAITLTVVGSPTAKKRVMIIGAIHGNERGGVPIAKAMAKSRAPAGVAYFVVSYPNPDGAALNTRHNARRVDLNRNFPGWRRNGGPGHVYYPGTGALSEPESRAIYAAINKIKPTAFITYHQHMNLVSFGGGSSSAGSTYARQSGLRIDDGTVPAYRGSQATWLSATYPRTLVMTVELPARVPAAMVNGHITALKYLAGHH